jgi:membrane protein implicated in regulation of membrane protease activity
VEVAVIIIVVVALVAVGWLLASRMRPSAGTVGRPVPVGTAGVVQAPLTPLGTVLLGGETWSARTPDDRRLERGAHVRLIRFDGLIAIVVPLEPAGEPPTSPPPAPPTADPT